MYSCDQLSSWSVEFVFLFAFSSILFFFLFRFQLITSLSLSQLWKAVHVTNVATRITSITRTGPDLTGRLLSFFVFDRSFSHCKASI